MPPGSRLYIRKIVYILVRIYEPPYLICRVKRFCLARQGEPGHTMDALAFFKCLADDTRLRCLLLIQREQELCVCELTQALQEIQPKISRHLAQLRQCKLVEDRRQGQWVFYRVHPALPDWAREVLGDTLAGNPDFLAPNLALLQQMGERPERAQVCC